MIRLGAFPDSSYAAPDGYQKTSFTGGRGNR